MKLINLTIFTLTLLIGGISLHYLKPLITRNGTSVITAPIASGKVGGTQLTIKIPSNMTQKQLELLNYAFDVAKSDGHKVPQYVQGIIMQESKAGNMKDFRVAGLTNRVGDHYFGIAQVKLSTAKSVMSRYPSLWEGFDTHTDEELQARLITDDKFNIRVASKLLLMLNINENPESAITAYNLGEGGAQGIANKKEFHYNVGVKNNMNKLKKVLTN